MSTETKVVSTNWRLVQVGRVVLVQNKLAAVVEIIDQKRVRISLEIIQQCYWSRSDEQMQ